MNELKDAIAKRDLKMDCLWSVFIQLLMYGSAIFYQVDKMSPAFQRVFAFNPVYRHIAYVREIVLDGAVPPLATHLTLDGATTILVSHSIGQVRQLRGVS